jgi:hypothetical protein
MKPLSIGFILLAVGVFAGSVQVAVLGAEARSSGLPKWEYRVLTKDEVVKLGQKDLTAGLNRLGDAGWSWWPSNQTLKSRHPGPRRNPPGSTSSAPRT